MGRKNRTVHNDKPNPNAPKPQGVLPGKADLRPGTKLGKKIKKKTPKTPDVHIEFGSLVQGLGSDDDLLDIDMDLQDQMAGGLLDSDEEVENNELERIEKEHREKSLKASRKAPLEEKKNNKLPIKDQQGKLILAKDLPRSAEDKENDEKNQFSDEMDSDNEEGSPEEENKTQEPGLPPIKSPAYLKLRLEQLASAAQKIISDPETHYNSLKVLKGLAVDKNIQVRKFALLTQLSVFTDILPGYRIRALTEEEKTIKVTKEVRNLRLYEAYLVSSYQSYLKVLTNQYRLASTNPARHGELRTVVAKCYSELMATKHGFNFSDDLFSFVARRLATTHQDAVYDMCADATVRLFKEDDLGQSSLRMVQALTKSIKHKEYRVSPATIRLFLHLKFNINVLETLNKKDEPKAGDKRSHTKMTLDLVLSSEKRAHISKKMKKRKKAQKVIDQEMREAEAEYSVEERSKVQSELLKNIFVIYFRILKHATSTRLFPVTLEGLSRFGHLINVDFFTDLLNLLKGVLRNGLVSNQMASAQDEPTEHSSSEVVRCQLLCILTAFKLLTGQGEVLNLDLKDFYMFLYALLPVAAHMTEGFTDSAAPARPGEFEVPSIPLLVVDCIDALFFRNRRDRVPLVRAAAFFKRTVSIAYHFPHKTAAKLLVMAKAFVIKYPGVVRLLSSEEIAGDGEFAAMATDPDMANPFATSLFELPGLLHNHYDPSVRRAAQGLLKATLARN